MTLLILLLLGIKVGGTDFVPKDLVFAAAEPKSRATADGALPDGCKWEFVSETRLGKKDDGQGCMRYYYKTSVTLEQTCSAPNEKKARRYTERVTSTGPFCPDGGGKVQPPNVESKVVSSGITADGKHQEIVTQPDGTRVTLQYNDTGVTVTVVYPDGTADTLVLP